MTSEPVGDSQEQESDNSLNVSIVDLAQAKIERMREEIYGLDARKNKLQSDIACLEASLKRAVGT